MAFGVQKATTEIGDNICLGDTLAQHFRPGANARTLSL
jgi:hypothetical protein